MKSFRCGDVVPGCTRSFVASEQDLLTDVARPAQTDHGLLEVPAALVV